MIPYLKYGTSVATKPTVSDIRIIEPPGVTGAEEITLHATNTTHVIGTVTWTNYATGASGTYPASAGSAEIFLELALDTNIIVLLANDTEGKQLIYEHTLLRAGTEFVFPSPDLPMLLLNALDTTNVIWQNGWMGTMGASNYLAWSSNGINGVWMNLTNGTAHATVTNYIFTAPLSPYNSPCYFRVVHYVTEDNGWYTNYSDEFSIIPEPHLLFILAMWYGVLLLRRCGNR